jgi:acetyl esterase/lipase
MRIFIQNQVLLRFLLIFTFFSTFQVSLVMGQSQKLMGMKEVIGVDYVEPDTVIQYGADEYNFAELRIPKHISSASQFPVVVIIHGGCWLSAVANADFMRGYASALTQEGYATYNIEYRSADHPDGGWPNTFNDVISAVNYLSEFSSDYPLNLNEVILIGHSAGGHLALWTSIFPQDLPKLYPITELKTRIHGVISLAGIVDLKEYYDPSGQSCGRGVGQLLDGSPDELPNLYQITSPVNIYQSSSKLSLVLMTGELDPIVKPSHVGILSEAFPEIEHLILPQTGHFEMVVPQTMAWERTLAVLKKMLDQPRSR